MRQARALGFQDLVAFAATAAHATLPEDVIGDDDGGEVDDDGDVVDADEQGREEPEGVHSEQRRGQGDAERDGRGH